MTSAPTRHVVEVNECRVIATRAGFDYWAMFRDRHATTGRITTAVASLGGDLVHVECDDHAAAVSLAAHLVHVGLPSAAVKARKLPVAAAPVGEEQTT